MRIMISDYINKTYNQWTIIAYDEQKSKEKRCTYFICECTCKTRKSVALSSLKRGQSKSCGCLRKITSSLNGKKGIIDLTGITFGKLTVKSYNEEKSKNSSFGSYWNCECECGNKCIVAASNLKRGYVSSCGCLISKGEEKIQKILSILNLNYKKQYNFKDLIGETRPLKFDFAIFNNNDLLFLIEYQGKQHYFQNSFLGGEEDFNKRIKYDNKKVEYCKNKHIPLIIIPYSDYEIIDESYLKNKIMEVYTL